MKTFTYFALVCLACGCGHNEFDISPDQVGKKMVQLRKSAPDLNHLPPGAIKHDYKFKKGDQLPDGTIAPSDEKMTVVDLPKDATGHGGQMVMVTAGSEMKK